MESKKISTGNVVLSIILMLLGLGTVVYNIKSSNGNLSLIIPGLSIICIGAFIMYLQYYGRSEPLNK